ncbi:hypothetical protein PQH03_15245 [Ralstonia insidiosa]|jgi:hypothetical protein|uniref:imm11 family protein n=1 Tax=Ralstonia TaxID=48736 RepID=UPI0006649EB5|nr:DUF1629 domain-containing protein [Ralstonia insidiosa]KMW47103.1 hypothetical protein AC240_11355 [Ralstonia sp. MD27]MBX3775127.1 hypothetical protein [Ralstonia pickettii]NOZ17836.1 hypothetical protein [Betaproteobacteria bacterium]MBA9859969.1 hypothetical protein [Ralstonia insidiosa]MBA9872588.1 hypothetical protein [Ralstonia insidiosa]
MRSKLRGLKTMGGVSLAGEFPELTLAVQDGYDAPPGLVDYFKVGLLHVVSERLKAVLSSHNAELEYFPAVVMYNGSATEVKYFVANPLKRIKAIDLGKSDIELDGELGDALWVKKLVLNESCFSGIKLAVIDEVQRIGLQQEIALAVESAGCTGCSFVSPATVRYGYR